MALAWADKHFRYGEDQNAEQYKRNETQSRAVLKVFIRPRQRHLQLGFIIDFLIDSPAQLRHVDSLHLHAEPGLKKVVVDDRSGDAH